MERERLIDLLSAVDSSLNIIKADLEKAAPYVLDYSNPAKPMSRTIRDRIYFAKDILIEIMDYV